MNPLEDQLRQSLRRIEPPEGFAGRVLERVRSVDSEPSGSQILIRSKRRRWLAAAAALLLLSGAAYLEQERMRRADGERARAQLLLALQITSHKLNSAMERINTEKGNP